MIKNAERFFVSQTFEVPLLRTLYLDLYSTFKNLIVIFADIIISCLKKNTNGA